MAPIDFDKIQESEGGAGRLPNGPYVLKVLSVDYSEKDNWGNDREYVSFVFDVAEGAHADELAGRPDFTHTLDLYFNKKGLGLTKRALRCMTESNPDFDAMRAFNCVIDESDQYHGRALKAFEGKVFGGNVVQYHKPKKDGSDGTTERVWVVYTADEVRNGKSDKGKEILPLEDQYKSGYTPAQTNSAPEQAPAIELADDVIPF